MGYSLHSAISLDICVWTLDKIINRGIELRLCNDNSEELDPGSKLSVRFLFRNINSSNSHEVRQVKSDIRQLYLEYSM